jgi:hypothetical protein
MGLGRGGLRARRGGGRAPEGGGSAAAAPAPRPRARRRAPSPRPRPRPSNHPPLHAPTLYTPSPSKAYYRRGDAYFALGKFKEAVKDLRTVGGAYLCVCVCVCVCVYKCVCMRAFVCAYAQGFWGLAVGW